MAVGLSQNAAVWIRSRTHEDSLVRHPLVSTKTTTQKTDFDKTSIPEDNFTDEAAQDFVNSIRWMADTRMKDLAHEKNRTAREQGSSKLELAQYEALHRGRNLQTRKINPTIVTIAIPTFTEKSTQEQSQKHRKSNGNFPVR
ncbi:hypothetical protein ACFX1T_022420 [Malus domestica]